MWCRASCSHGFFGPAGRDASATSADCGPAPGFGTSHPHTQNDGMLRRRDVKAHDIAHFGHEVRIGRELERLHSGSGWSPKARQMRCTVDTDRPLAFAMPRELQWVAFSGQLSSVLMITASMRSSSIVKGAVPERGSSYSPATRCSTKRRRHLPTVCRSKPSLAATSLF